MTPAHAASNRLSVPRSLVRGIAVLATLPIEQVAIPIFRHDLSQRGEAVAWEGASAIRGRA